MRKIATIMLLILLLSVSAVAQTGAVFTEDFSTDPFATRWINTPHEAGNTGQMAVWDSANGVLDLKYSSITTSDNFDIDVSSVASYKFDFKTTSNLGAWVRVQPFMNPGANNGYGLVMYQSPPAYSCWFLDSGTKMTLVGGSDKFSPLTVGQWYTLKVDLSATATKSYVTLTLTDTATGSLVSYVKYCDSSATRYTVQKGLYIKTYPGDNWPESGPYIDNIAVTESTPAPTFSPDGGNLISQDGATATFITIKCATEGATIRYTTDGTDPSETNGIQCASGTQVSVSNGSTLKAKAWADGLAESEIKAAAYTFQANWYEDFNTNPFDPTNPRWAYTSLGSQPFWDEQSGTLYANYAAHNATSNFVLSTNYGASYSYEFITYSTLGPQAKSYAFRNPGFDNGYEINPYVGISKWLFDPRLSVIGGSETLGQWQTEKWYRVKVDMLDDVSANRSVVSATLTRVEDNQQMGYIQLADSSPDRLTTHKGFAVWTYPGDGSGDSGPDLDNIYVTSNFTSAAESVG